METPYLVNGKLYEFKAIKEYANKNGDKDPNGGLKAVQPCLETEPKSVGLARLNANLTANHVIYM